MKFKYQSIILAPQNKAIKVPKTRKGAKGTSVFRVFPFKAINIVPITAPIRKDRNKASKVLGQLNKRPKKKTNLTSPKPSHFPRETKKIAKKKAVAREAARKGWNKLPKSKLQVLKSKAMISR